MLSVIMLVIVTLFAVLGAYYVSDLLTEGMFRKRHISRITVLLATDCLEDMWNGVLDLRAKMPHTNIIVLCKEGTPTAQRREPSLRDVVFATPETVGAVVCEQLLVQQAAAEKQDDTNDTL